MSRQDRATTERNVRTLRELVKQSENKVCADCKRNDPRWASWNIGVFLCIRCSGIHRGMGTHISKVKSVDLDMWTPEQMESIQKWGNRRANLYWEAHLKPGHIPPEHKMESFIRSKYESRRWAMDGPPPHDPAVLDSGNAAQTTPAPASAPSQDQSTTVQAKRSSYGSGSANPSRGSRFTSQQPQPHRLLSSNFSEPNPARASTPPAAVQATQAVQPPAPQDDLFSLDFHAPPSVTPANAAPQQPVKDVKQDILSLFSANPANSNPNPNSMNQFGMGAWNAQPQTQASVQASVQSTSMIGNTGIGAWGASSGWAPATAAPAQSNVWSTQASSGLSPQQANIFNTNDIWGGNSVPAGGSTFSSTTQKKDDVFGDLWGSFK